MDAALTQSESPRGRFGLSSDVPFTFLGMLYFKQRITDDGTSFTTALDNRPDVQSDLPKVLAGGTGAALWSAGIETVCVRPEIHYFRAPKQKVLRAVFDSAAAVERVLHSLDGLHAFVESAGDKVKLALSAADIRRAQKEGKLALVLHFTGAWLNGSLAVLRSYHRLGVRGLQVAITDNGDWIDSASEPDGVGLDGFGREVITEMNRLGMLVDVSHASDRATSMILEVSTKPVVASHSNARALCDVRRNLPDDLIKRIADKGGAIGIHFWSGFTREGYLKEQVASGFYAAGYEHARQACARFGAPPLDFHHARLLARALRNGLDDLPKPRASAFQMPKPATLDDLVRHVDHLVDLAGIDHVAVGADWGGIGPECVGGLDDASKLPNLVRALEKHGYTSTQIEKILGANLLRVFESAVG